MKKLILIVSFLGVLAGCVSKSHRAPSSDDATATEQMKLTAGHALEVNGMFVATSNQQFAKQREYGFSCVHKSPDYKCSMSTVGKIIPNSPRSKVLTFVKESISPLRGPQGEQYVYGGRRFWNISYIYKTSGGKEVQLQCSVPEGNGYYQIQPSVAQVNACFGNDVHVIPAAGDSPSGTQEDLGTFVTP